MVEISDQKFEDLVTECWLAIPEQFRQQLKNVAIVWSHEPTAEQLRQSGLKSSRTLFGLYEGVPQIVRGSGYSALPDKVTIFKKAITESCESLVEVKQQIAETIWHELAHHFGSSEERVRSAQNKRRARMRKNVNLL